MTTVTKNLEKEKRKSIMVSHETHKRLMKRRYAIQNELREDVSLDSLIEGLLNQTEKKEPVVTSLDRCPFKYCDSNPVCAETCRYNEAE
jgi:hypothetical protein